MSEAEEMYLLTIADLSEQNGDGPIPLSDVAQQLSILPASANQMIHKLEAKRLVSYVPYQGVRLEPDGWEIANRVLRRRRLWELFLVRHLGLLPQVADDLACRFEHVTPHSVVERLSAYLGHPETGVLGRPIPKGSTSEAAVPALNLRSLVPGQEAAVQRIDADQAAKEYLEAQGIQAGRSLLVMATAEEGQILVKAGGHQSSISPQLASQIYVERTNLEIAHAVEDEPNAM